MKKMGWMRRSGVCAGSGKMAKWVGESSGREVVGGFEIVSNLGMNDENARARLGGGVGRGART